MSAGLKTYKKKRDFEQTPEPEGRIRSTPGGRLFVVQKHAATRLHYDFRLELDGVLVSWAIPKGPSLDPSEKRLAVRVEDHPVEYGSFEGIIPKNEYGGGTVLLWDRGDWEPIEDPKKGLQKGRLKFHLHGEKLKGGWTLVRMGGRKREDKTWLLIKERDEEARPATSYDVLKDQPLSVSSGRDLEQIAAQQKRVWTSQGEVRQRTRRQPAWPDAKKIPGAKKKKQPKHFRPQLGTLGKEPPNGDEWLHEIKLDGYRLLAAFEKGKVRLWTRNQKDWTHRFEETASALEQLGLEDGILDGEIAALRPDGISDFQALQNSLEGREREYPLVYFAFDLPHYRGFDLSQSPLIERKEALRAIMAFSPGPDLRFSDHVQGRGEEFLEQACNHHLEGIISKRVDAPYEQKRSRSWLKVKCLHRQEFVIGGFTEPGGSRTAFGAFLLGYYEGKNLIYCGRVGTGFTEESLRSIFPILQKLETDRPAFKNPPQGAEAKDAHWTRPELVAEVAFSEWTEEEIIRHASFQGLRSDRSPREVRREKPVAPPPKPNSSGTGKSGSPRTPEIGGVRFSNPDRVLFPEHDVTKMELAEYYQRVAEQMLPHITGRPLTLVRCPKGRSEDCFYQKHFAEALPETLRGISIREKKEESIYIVLDDAAGLLTLIQLAVLEIHPWGSHENDLEHPDRMVFDLDPGPGVTWEDIFSAAKAMHEFLLELGLQSFPKTSGGKGLHVMIPLVPRADWTEVKEFSRAIANHFAKAAPQRFTATASKAKREGRIFIDYLRNSRGATAVAAYSTRARAGAPVSTPVRWDELSKKLRPDAYNIRNIARRLSSLKGDPWEGFFSSRQTITQEMKRRLGM